VVISIALGLSVGNETTPNASGETTTIVGLGETSLRGQGRGELLLGATDAGVACACRSRRRTQVFVLGALAVPAARRARRRTQSHDADEVRRTRLLRPACRYREINVSTVSIQLCP
jgi:hypothetical protein